MVPVGGRLKRCDLKPFESWVGRDVTDELLNGEYQKWDFDDPSKNK